MSLGPVNVLNHGISIPTMVMPLLSYIGILRGTTISSPGWSPKQPLPRIGLHDLLYGRQVALNSTHFTRGLVKYIPGRGYFRAVPFQNEDTFATFPTPPIVERPGTRRIWYHLAVLYITLTQSMGRLFHKHLVAGDLSFPQQPRLSLVCTVEMILRCHASRVCELSMNAFLHAVCCTIGAFS